MLRLGPILKRRAMLSIAFLPLALDPAHAGQFDGITIRIATFGGTWHEVIEAHVGKAFAAEGGRIEYVMSTPQANLAKLVASRGQEPPFDILETLDELFPVLQKGNFLQPIDLKNVPNSASLDLPTVDPMRLPIYLTEEGIVFNRKKLQDAGIPEPKTFADLAAPRLRGKVIIPDISASAAIPLLVGMARERGGAEDNIDPGLQLVREMAPALFWTSSAIVATQLANGDAWVALGQAAHALRMKNQIDVGFVHPAVGGKRGILKQNYMVLVKGGKNQRAAEWVLNALLSKDMQIAFLSEAGEIPVSHEALTILSADPRYAFARLKPEDMANMYRVDYSKVNINAYVQKWNRAVVR